MIKFIKPNDGTIKWGASIVVGDNLQLTEDADCRVQINATGTGGASSILDDLLDVVITSVADDQFLRYDVGTNKWINQLITAADVGPGTFKVGAFTFPNQLILTAGNDIGLGTTTPTATTHIMLTVASGAGVMVGANANNDGTQTAFLLPPNPG